MHEKIKELCKKKGITVQQLERALGFGNGTISSMSEKSQPSKLKKVADYFSIDFYDFMGWNRDVPDYEPEFVELIDLYSRLKKEQKKTVLDMLRSFALSN